MMSKISKKLGYAVLAVGLGASCLTRAFAGTEPAGSTPGPLAPTTISAAPAVNEAWANANRVWQVRASDRNVRETLSRWSSQAGWQLSWEVPKDIELHASAPFKGSFEDALEGLLSSLQGSDYPISACTYEGNHVVRIVKSTLICEHKAQ